MRISDEKNLSGYFWLCANSEKRIPGTLKISDGGKIELEILGNFDSNPFQSFISSESKTQRILGIVEKEGYVTLDDCFRISGNISLSGGISKSTFRVARMFSSVHYEDDEPILFDSVQFSIEGFDEWLGITGIKVEVCH